AALDRDHGVAHRRMAADRRDEAVDVRRANQLRDVPVAKQHGLEAVRLVAARTAHVNARRACEPAERRSVLGVHALLDRGEGQCAVHEPGVDEIRAQADGKRVPNRALAGTRWSIDRDRQGTPCAGAALRRLWLGTSARECADLGCRETPPLTRREATERHRPEADSNQPPDRVADRSKEASALPFAALPDPDTQPGSLLVPLASYLPGRLANANA